MVKYVLTESGVISVRDEDVNKVTQPIYKYFTTGGGASTPTVVPKTPTVVPNNTNIVPVSLAADKTSQTYAQAVAERAKQLTYLREEAYRRGIDITSDVKQRQFVKQIVEEQNQGQLKQSEQGDYEQRVTGTFTAKDGTEVPIVEVYRIDPISKESRKATSSELKNLKVQKLLQASDEKPSKVQRLITSTQRGEGTDIQKQVTGMKLFGYGVGASLISTKDFVIGTFTSPLKTGEGVITGVAQILKNPKSVGKRLGIQLKTSPSYSLGYAGAEIAQVYAFPYVASKTGKATVELSKSMKLQEVTRITSNVQKSQEFILPTVLKTEKVLNKFETPTTKIVKNQMETLSSKNLNLALGNLKQSSQILKKSIVNVPSERGKVLKSFSKLNNKYQGSILKLNEIVKPVFKSEALKLDFSFNKVKNLLIKSKFPKTPLSKTFTKGITIGTKKDKYLSEFVLNPPSDIQKLALARAKNQKIKPVIYDLTSDLKWKISTQLARIKSGADVLKVKLGEGLKIEKLSFESKVPRFKKKKSPYSPTQNLKPSVSYVEKAYGDIMPKPLEYKTKGGQQLQLLQQPKLKSPKQKLKLKQEVKIYTIVTPKQAEKIKLKYKTLQLQQPKQQQLSNQLYRVEQRTKTIQLSSSKFAFGFLPKTSQRLAQPQLQRFKQTQSQKYAQPQISGLAQPQRVGQAQRVGQKYKTKTPTTPKLKLIKPSKKVTPFPKVKQTTTPKFSGGLYGVQVRRYGKFRTIGTGLSLGKAINLGKQRTAGTLGATYKITGKTINLPTPFGYYKKPTKEGTLFIELPKYRLSTGGEKLEIQYAKRLKGGKK